MIGFNVQTRATLKDLLHLAWPVVLARIGIMTMGLTDVIVVGNWSGLELAYSSLALAPTSIIITTAVGLMMGVCPGAAITVPEPLSTTMQLN